MIDRSRVIFWLRPRTIGQFASAAVCLFAVLPVGAVVCALSGWIAFGLCWLLIILLVLLAFVGIFGGVLAILAGLATKGSEQAGIIGAGVGGLVIGGISRWANEQCHTTLSQAASDAVSGCMLAAEYLFVGLWQYYQVYLWAWIPLIFVLAVAAAILGTIGLVRLETPLKYSLLKIGYCCPKCHIQSVPIFRCGNCSSPISDLRSSPYGVFKAKCAKCGGEVPTADLCGRLSLQKVCSNPKCARDLENTDLGTHGEFHIGLVGAASSGKSNLLVTLLWKFIEDFAKPNNIDVRFASPTDQFAYDQWIQQLQHGVPVGQTASAPVPKALVVSVVPPQRRGQSLYLYDAAGEDLAEEGRMADFHFHKNLDGLIFVIDPFAEEGIRDLLLPKQQLQDITKVNPAARPAAEMAARLIGRLERILGRASGARLPVPLAVVITKLDACGLEAELDGVTEVTGFCSDMASAAQRSTIKSDRLRGKLVNAGLGNLLNILETSFACVAYFGVSALGRMPTTGDQSTFQPRGTCAPILWLSYHTGGLTGASPFTQIVRNGWVTFRRALWGYEGRYPQVMSWTLLVCSASVLLCLGWYCFY